MSEQNILNQVAVTIGTNLLTVGYGASIGWSSNGMVFLQSNETTLQEGVFTKDGGKLSFSSSLSQLICFCFLMFKMHHG